MEKYKCLVIEDEPLAAEILEDYIRQISFLELKGVSANALDALDILQAGDVDVIFLDIHLPKLKGLDFIRTLKTPPQIIITTAFREYALDGYELNVVDYLLKPVSLSRFIGAVNKLKVKSQAISTNETTTINSTEENFFLININKKKIKIYLDEVLFIESKKEYINIITSSDTYLAKYQLTDIEALLNKLSFMRIHRSFIVSMKKIKAYTATDVEINGFKIPIGRSYKELVLAALENKAAL